jgi:hypothetical protein
MDEEELEAKRALVAERTSAARERMGEQELADKRARDAERKRKSRENTGELKGTPKLEQFFTKKT